MGKKQFRIGDLAKELKVKKFVVRFWEKEFDLKSDRSNGGQRFYTTDDLLQFMLIKDLLYNQGFTIAGAKKQLDEQLKKGGAVVVLDTKREEDILSKKMIEQAALASQVTPAQKTQCDCRAIVKELKTFKNNLIDFRKTLG